MMKDVYENMLKKNEIEKELLEFLIQELQPAYISKDCCLSYLNGYLKASKEHINFYKKQLEGV